VQVVVDTPTDLEPEVEEALRQIAAVRGEDVAPADKGFFSRIKSAFH
jgi:DnaJ-class molecular chaperone